MTNIKLVKPRQPYQTCLVFIQSSYLRIEADIHWDVYISDLALQTMELRRWRLRLITFIHSEP